MAKISSSLAGKLKNMARELKDEDESKGSIKKLGERIKGPSGAQKKDTDGNKVSGRKD